MEIAEGSMLLPLIFRSIDAEEFAREIAGFKHTGSYINTPFYLL